MEGHRFVRAVQDYGGGADLEPPGKHGAKHTPIDPLFLAVFVSRTLAFVISICIPAHEGAFPLLKRTLLSFAEQTWPDFEVCVAIDGPGQFQVPEVPYSLAFVRTPRTDSPLPHRNHARNAAAGIARGEFLWFVDGDFLWDTWLIEHMIKAGKVPLSPVLVGIRGTPESWMADTRWDSRQRNHQEHLRTLSVVGDQWSGYAKHYRRGRGPEAKDMERMPEGFPLVRKADFTGFDERFLGWGGTKESYIKALPDYRWLLTSARGYHQPHSKSASTTQSAALTAHNNAMYDAIPPGGLYPWPPRQQ